jgi:peptidoglycan/xylan/chitin deacetylase (PgdA/CDA1 family)
LKKHGKYVYARKLNAITNFALGVILFSVGAICFAPLNDAIESGGEKTEIYRFGDTESNAISLTFNVYWGTEEVYEILEVLEKHNAKATFFIGGCWADDNVQCLRTIYESGHEIGNHGYFHKDHAKLSLSDNRREIQDCNAFIERAIGVKPTLFAPPSGSYGESTLSVCQGLGMKTVLWSKDTIDWRDKDAALIYTRATKNVKGGDFVLMHPMQDTVDALSDILNEYKKRGLTTVTVSENLREKG